MITTSEMGRYLAIYKADDVVFVVFFLFFNLFFKIIY